MATDSVRDNRIVWGLVVLAIIVLAGLLWVWSLGSSLTQIDQRSQQLVSRLDSAPTEEAIAALSKRQDELDARLAALAPADTTPLEGEIAEIRAALDGLRTQIGDLAPAAVNGLAARVATLETTVSQQQPVDLAPLQGDIDALKTQLGDLAPAQVAALDERVETLATQMAELAPTDLAPLQSDVDGLKTAVSALETQLATPQPAPDLSGIEQQLAELSSRVDALAGTSETPSETPTNVTDETSSEAPVETGGPDGADIAELQQAVTALQARLDTVETTLAQQGQGDVVTAADLTPLQTQLDDLAGRLAALAPTDLTPLDTRLTSVEGGLEALEGTVATLPQSGDLATLQAGLDALVARINDTPSAEPVDLTPIRSEIADVRQDLAALGGRVDGKADAGAVEDIATRLGQLESSVAALPRTDAAPLAADLAELKAGLAAVETRLGSKAESDDLQALRADLEAFKANPGQPKRTPVLVGRVYFGQSSAALDDTAQAQLATLADDLKANPRELSLMGFSDTSGAAEYNRALSVRRAGAVRRALVDAGIANGLIASVSGLGEDAPPVATGDNAAEPGNRVVLIYAYD